MPTASPPAQAPNTDHTTAVDHGMPPGAALVQAAHQQTFTAVYQQHVERIYRYHLARTGRVEDAQDLTAETFQAALEGFTGYDPARGPAAAWLMGIAQHKLVDHFRRYRSTLPLAQVEDQPDRGASTEDASLQHLQMAQVAAALLALPADRAEALSLHFFAGLSLNEAAQVMRRSDEAVKKLIHRGLADLRRRLAYPPAAAASVEVNP
jgi:RNA polymerase sigma-70 factor (ECF subfamily)